MTSPIERIEVELAGDEATLLTGFLDYHRATLQQKAAGLDAAGMAATLGPSSLTIGGLLKHMAFVEDNWFSVVLHGHDYTSPWSEADWAADGDWEFTSAASDSPEELRELHRTAVAESRRLAEGLALDTVSKRNKRPEDQPVTVRWILIHMLEEYARHNGHADLIRESVDGQVGE